MSRLFIGNLSSAVTKEDLREHFAKHGTIVETHRLRDKDFAFVQYEDEAVAKKAVEVENGRPLKGNRIVVEFAKSRDRDRNRDRERDRDRSPHRRRSSVQHAEVRELHQSPSQSTQEQVNDVEIIVFTEKQKQYAERIEGYLKSVKVSCDLLFPREEFPLPNVLSNLLTKGTKFAIVIEPEQEHQRMATLYVLKENPEEHKNITIDNVIKKITSLQLERSTGKSSGIRELSCSGHPDNILRIICYLRDNRELSLLEYDEIIDYLEEKKNAQIQLEQRGISSGPPVSSDNINMKLLDILNTLSNDSKADTQSSIPALSMDAAQEMIESIIKEPDAENRMLDLVAKLKSARK